MRNCNKNKSSKYKKGKIYKSISKYDFLLKGIPENENGPKNEEKNTY